MLLNATGQKKIGLKKKLCRSNVFVMCIFVCDWIYLELHAIVFRNFFLLTLFLFSEGVGYFNLSFNINLFCIFVCSI